MKSSTVQNDVLTDVKMILSELSPMIASLEHYAWTGPTGDQQWEFLQRSAVIRQREAVETMIKLAELGHGHFGVTLLRPAFEELVWIDYLKQNDEAAIELVGELARKELADTLGAQSEYLSVDEMHAVGFTMRWVKRVLPELEKSNDRLKRLGKRLGWREGASLPSMSLLCRKTGRTKEYNYLYQATSRYVHFSPHELLRRVWGQHGAVTISSGNFSRFWTDFALYWGFRLLLETLVVAKIRSLEEAAPRLSAEFQSRIERLRKVQVITASELEKWAEPKTYNMKN